VTDERAVRPAVKAASSGNAMEWFDFGVHAYPAGTIGRVFFPSGSDTAQLLSSFATFAVAFLVRPLGGMVFGPTPAAGVAGTHGGPRPHERTPARRALRTARRTRGVRGGIARVLPPLPDGGGPRTRQWFPRRGHRPVTLPLAETS
jgi:hypothetical protein